MILLSLNAIQTLEMLSGGDCSVIIKWFSDALLKRNDEKRCLMVFGDNCKEKAIKIGNSEIKESDYEKLLGITFDKKLNFKKHIEDFCRKVN